MKKTILGSIALLFILFVKFNAEAAVETFNSREAGEKVKNGLTLYVADDKYDYMRTHSNWSSVFTNHKVTNKVILSIDPYGKKFMNQAFTLKVKVEITLHKWIGSGFLQEIQEKELEIQYTLSGPYKDKNIFLIENGGHRMEVRVIGFPSLPATLGFVPNIALEAEMQVERYYAFNTNYIMPASSLRHSDSYVINRNELLVSWDHVSGAEEYDLEWTHINNYDDEGNKLSIFEIKADPIIFRLNSTRITTSNTSYPIPLAFEPGFILYRVRPVGRDPQAQYTQPLPGSWSKDPSICPFPSFVAFCMYPHVYQFNGLSSKFNWQSSVDYIEGGKNKVGITYFDASLRTRQQVSKLNTEDKTLVGEILYDHQGRPAITTLPVPENKQSILYSNNFNRNLQGQAYSKKDFESNNANCVTAAPMEEQIRDGKTGAANYYSPSNPDKSDQQAFLPNAKGYPFVQTQYTLDNTGRIRAQSGAGENFKIGSGHETKFYYGQPFQEELDRLFGLDVGFDKNYRKNVVIDPNGQATVTYLDAQGNVIATALAGNAPQTLEPLAGVVERPLSIDLLSKINPTDPSGSLDMLSPDGKTKILNRNYIASASGPRDLHYDIHTGTFKNQCEIVGAGAAERCYNCVVNVSLSVKDECGNEILSPINNGSYTKTVGEISPGCTVAPGAFETDANALNLQVGSYQISKIVSIDQEALNEYTADFLDPVKNPCIKKFEVFLGEELSKVDSSGCETDCKQCREKIGVFPSWELNDYNLAHNPNCNPCLEKEQYEKLIGTCDRFCDNEAINCETGLLGMLSDVSPFGQYGGVIANTAPPISGDGILNSDVNGSEIDPSQHKLSVFNVGNKLPSHEGTPNWKYPKHYNKVDNLHYFTDNGEIAYVDILVLRPEGTSTVPRFFPEIDNSAQPSNPRVGTTFKVEPHKLKDIKDFLAFWQPTWNQSLVNYHPEYGYYKLCIATQASHKFDAKWLAVDKVEEARVKFGFGTNLSNLPKPLGNDPASAKDPYFSSNLSENPRYQQWEYKLMKYIMDNYKFKMPLGQFNIWQVAHIAANCPNYSRSATSCPNCLDTYNGINTDEEWIQFRSLYLSLKQSLQDYKTRLETIKSGCYNGCVGVENFDPSTFNIYDPATNAFNYWVYHFSPYFFSNQTCYKGRKDLFKNKVKRFPTASDLAEVKKDEVCYEELPIPIDNNGTVTTLNFPAVDELQACEKGDENTIKELEERADRIIYETCGQCPLARDIQFLLDGVAREDRNEQGNITKPSQLTDVNTFNLSCYPFESKYKEFTPDLEKALDLPGTSTIVWDQLSLTTKKLEVNIRRTSGNKVCKITLVIPPDSPYEMKDIRGMCCLHYESNPTLLPLELKRNFKIDGVVTKTVNSNGTTEYEKVTLEGVSCIDISTCPMLPVCTVTAEGEALESLFDALISESTPTNNKFVTNALPPVDILSPTPGQYDPYASIIDGVLNKPETGGLTATNWVWKSTEGTNMLSAQLKDKNSSAAILIEFFLPPNADFTFKNIISVENLRSDRTNGNPEHNFEINALVKKLDGSKKYVLLKGFSSVYKISNCRSVQPTTN